MISERVTSRELSIASTKVRVYSLDMNKAFLPILPDPPMMTGYYWLSETGKQGTADQALNTSGMHAL